MSIFSFPCHYTTSITQTSTFGYLNPPSKASGIAVALFQLQAKSRAYDIMNEIYLICMIVFLIIAQIFDMQEVLHLAIGIGLVYAISMLVNSIVSSYYNEI